MILFTDPFYEETLDDLRLMGDVRLEPPGEQDGRNSARAKESPFLAVHISRDLALQMLRPLGLGLEEIQRAVDSGKKPRELILKG